MRRPSLVWKHACFLGLTLGLLLFGADALADVDLRKAVLAGHSLSFSLDAEFRTIKAEWIVQAIQKGVKIDLTNAIVDGDLKLQYAQCAKEVSFVDCEFMGSVDFSYATFKQNLILQGAVFDADANFNSVVCEYDLNLDGAVFPTAKSESGEQPTTKEVSFIDLHVKGALSMNGARFGEAVTAVFNRVSVEKACICRNSNFGGDVDFQASSLGSMADFRGSSFAHNATFGGAHISGQSHFFGAIFAGHADFGLTRLGGDVFFCASDQETDAQGAAVFKGNADFANAHFGGAAHFEGVWFNGEATFNGAEIKGDAGFDPDALKRPVIFGDKVTFVGATFAAVATFEGAQFNGKADFTQSHIVGEAVFAGTSFAGSATFADLQSDGAVLAFDQALFRDEVDLSRLHVSGDLIFESVTCKRTAKFFGSAVTGDGRFSHVGFVGDTFLEGAHFSRNFHLDGVICRGRMSLAQANVNGFADFHASTFQGPVVLDEATLGNTSFASSVFHKEVDCTLTHFKGVANLRGARFLGPVRFFKASVDGYLDSADAAFLDEADFTAASISGEAVFSNVIFGGPAVFEDSKIGGATSFTDAKFHGPRKASARSRMAANFSGCQFSGPALFSGAEFFKPVSFRETTFTSALFLPEQHISATQPPAKQPPAAQPPSKQPQFHGDLDLRGCSYNRIAVDWRSWLSHAKPYDRQPYTQLEAAFKIAGDDQGADNVYLARQKEEGNQEWQRKEYGAWLFNKLFGLFANYGVRPYRLIAISVLLLGLATVFFSDPRRVSHKETGPAGAASPDVEWTRWDAFKLAFHYFLPVDVLVGSWWTANEAPIDVRLRLLLFERHWKMRPSTVATILQIAGWILVPLGVAALTGLLRIKS